MNDADGQSGCSTVVVSWNQKIRTKIYSMYINSPGGSVTAGMAIYDTMNYIKCDVSTICIGMAASMGAFLLIHVVPKGKRHGSAKRRGNDPPAI